MHDSFLAKLYSCYILTIQDIEGEKQKRGREGEPEAQADATKTNHH